MSESIHFSIVAPLYNEEELCVELCQRIVKTMRETGDTFEVILVDDGSADETCSILSKETLNTPDLKLVKLSRNFGQEPAIFAGIEVAVGEEIILIDGDLQDPPEVIIDLINEKRKGYSIVCGRKIKRKEKWLRRNMTALFYILMHFFAQTNYPRNVGVFSILDRQALNWLKIFPETSVHLSGLRHYIGFKQSEVVYERAERSAGDSKSLYQLTRMGLNAFFAFSIFPLRFANFLLLLIALLGFSVLGWSLFSSIFIIDAARLDQVFNWFYILALVVLALSLVIFSEYIGRTFNMVKNRPVYIIDEVIKDGVVHKYNPVLSTPHRSSQLFIKDPTE